jgi:MFS family permease
MTEGFRWLAAQRGLLLLSLSATAFNFLFSLTFSFLVIYVMVGTHGTALLYGFVLASYAVGYGAGALLAGRFPLLRHAGKVWVLGYGLASGLLLVILALAPNPVVAIAANLGLGLFIGVSGTIWLTAAQHLVPSEMRGRYFAIDGVLSFIGGAPAIAAGGVLIAAFGILPVFEIAGVLMVLFAVLFAGFRSLWNLDGRPHQTVAPSR